MKIFSKYRSVSLTIMIIFAAVFIFTKCMDKRTVESGIIKNSAGQEFAGAAACAACHKDIYDHHLSTAHQLTSVIASSKFIKGSFEAGKNAFAYDQNRVVKMEARNNEFYQVAYINGTEKEARRMDIVIGSGTMGQSYLTWRDNSLFQLPVTYFTAANEWSNSPGYPNKIIFNRPITSRCLECHTSFAKVIPATGTGPEKFEPTQMMYGVTCEKCHGPAAQHVQFQTANPLVKLAKYIVNPAQLTRQQNLDLCASCHGGRLTKTTPSFEFSAGDTLSNFFALDTAAPDPNKIDVHGNQYGLLRASKCYLNSEILQCNTCHQSHENEKGKTALFSSRCITCHSEGHEPTCKMSKTIGPLINENCIDCHMPLKPSKAIAVFLPGKTAATAALIRSHFIGIYAGETKKVLEFINQRTH